MEEFETFEIGYKDIKQSSRFIAKSGNSEFYILDDIFIYVTDLENEEIERYDIENGDLALLFKKFGNADVINLIKYYSTWKNVIPDLKYNEFEEELRELQENNHIIFCNY